MTRRLLDSYNCKICIDCLMFTLILKITLKWISVNVKIKYMVFCILYVRRRHHGRVWRLLKLSCININESSILSYKILLN